MRVLAVLAIFLTSCNLTKAPSFGEMINENYAIQIMPLQIDDKEIPAFKIRIMPTQKILDKAGAELQNILWYDTDSCFYLKKNNINLQPDLVQPIANGKSNCYEYIVWFSEGPAFGRDELADFVFNDRKITHERYVIRF